jgi:hypothetical protein
MRGTIIDSQIWNGYSKLSRRLARYHRTIALFQSPLSERSVTVSVSLRSPAVNLVASQQHVTFSTTFGSPHFAYRMAASV